MFKNVVQFGENEGEGKGGGGGGGGGGKQKARGREAYRMQTRERVCTLILGKEFVT